MEQDIPKNSRSNSINTRFMNIDGEILPIFLEIWKKYVTTSKRFSINPISPYGTILRKYSELFSKSTKNGFFVPNVYFYKVLKIMEVTEKLRKTENFIDLPFGRIKFTLPPSPPSSFYCIKNIQEERKNVIEEIQSICGKYNIVEDLAWNLYFIRHESTLISNAADILELGDDTELNSIKLEQMFLEFNASNAELSQKCRWLDDLNRRYEKEMALAYNLICSENPPSLETLRSLVEGGEVSLELLCQVKKLRKKLHMNELKVENNQESIEQDLQQWKRDIESKNEIRHFLMTGEKTERFNFLKQELGQYKFQNLMRDVLSNTKDASLICYNQPLNIPDNETNGDPRTNLLEVEKRGIAIVRDHWNHKTQSIFYKDRIPSIRNINQELNNEGIFFSDEKTGFLLRESIKKVLKSKYHKKFLRNIWLKESIKEHRRDFIEKGRAIILSFFDPRNKEYFLNIEKIPTAEKLNNDYATYGIYVPDRILARFLRIGAKGAARQYRESGLPEIHFNEIQELLDHIWRPHNFSEEELKIISNFCDIQVQHLRARRLHKIQSSFKIFYKCNRDPTIINAHISQHLCEKFGENEGKRLYLQINAEIGKNRYIGILNHQILEYIAQKGYEEVIVTHPDWPQKMFREVIEDLPNGVSRRYDLIIPISQGEGYLSKELLRFFPENIHQLHRIIIDFSVQYNKTSLIRKAERYADKNTLLILANTGWWYKNITKPLQHSEYPNVIALPAPEVFRILGLPANYISFAYDICKITQQRNTDILIEEIIKIPSKYRGYQTLEYKSYLNESGSDIIDRHSEKDSNLKSRSKYRDLEDFYQSNFQHMDKNKERTSDIESVEKTVKEGLSKRIKIFETGGEDSLKDEECPRSMHLQKENTNPSNNLISTGSTTPKPGESRLSTILTRLQAAFANTRDDAAELGDSLTFLEKNPEKKEENLELDKDKNPENTKSWEERELALNTQEHVASDTTAAADTSPENPRKDEARHFPISDAERATMIAAADAIARVPFIIDQKKASLLSDAERAAMIAAADAIAREDFNIDRSTIPHDRQEERPESNHIDGMHDSSNARNRGGRGPDGGRAR